MSDAATSSCPGCGTVLADGPAPEQGHPGASPACARLFEDTLRGLRDGAGADRGAAATLRLADDAYAAQHPHPSDPGRLRAALAGLGIGGVPLGAPPEAWRTTISDVAADLDVVGLDVLVGAWARSVAEDWTAVSVATARGQGDPTS
jgi:hypothetical protein